MVLVVLACRFHSVLLQVAADEKVVANCDKDQTKLKDLVAFLEVMSTVRASALEGLVRAISILSEQQQEGHTRLSNRMSAMVAKVTERMTEHVRKITGVYNGQINSHLDELEKLAGQPALTSLREKWIAIDKADKDVDRRSWQGLGRRMSRCSCEVLLRQVQDHEKGAGE